MKFDCLLGQGFGQNYNNSYATSGLKGHTGIDETCGYGTDIHAYANGVVYSLWTPQNPASDGFTAVYLICNNGLEYYELVYGHVSEILVNIGDTVSKGQVVAREGNKGTVYSGGELVTLEMQANGDRRGSHRHVQKRILRRVKSASYYPLKNYQGIYTDPEGFQYEYAFPDNGYNGCVDFSLSLFSRDLFFGRSGYDVTLLQKALNMPPDLQTGFFGPLTLKAAIQYQKDRSISPTMGYVGPKTRALLNTVYTPL